MLLGEMLVRGVVGAGMRFIHLLEKWGKPCYHEHSLLLCQTPPNPTLAVLGWSLLHRHLTQHHGPRACGSTLNKSVSSITHTVPCQEVAFGAIFHNDAPHTTCHSPASQPRFEWPLCITYLKVLIITERELYVWSRRSTKNKVRILIFPANNSFSHEMSCHLK